MILNQRKSHKYIWLVITIAMPFFLFFAIKDLDFSSKSSTLQPKQVTANIEGNILQIQLNEPFKSPSPLVYEIDANGKAGKIIGQLAGVGNYKFMVTSKVKGIVVMDGIKKDELFKIEF